MRQGTWNDYEEVMGRAQKAFREWRMVPAPKRGEIVRQLGVELRKCKEPLGKLVSLTGSTRGSGKWFRFMESLYAPSNKYH